MNTAHTGAFGQNIGIKSSFLNLRDWYDIRPTVLVNILNELSYD